jgi:biotin carboxyl carrier protein
MRIYKIKVNGKTFEVKVMGITEVEPTEVQTVKGTVPASAPAAAAAPAPVAAAPVGDGTKVEAPMQGTILNVKVKVGDAVKAGDTVVILEAMKLENEIKAPVAGKIVDVRVSKGQQVNSKDLLVVIA